MGMSDQVVIPQIAPHISSEINKLKKDARVAWLGQRHPAMGNTNVMYRTIMNNVNVEIQSDFYDLHNDADIAQNSHIWDVNSEWDFSGYDLIVAVRIFYACTSASQLVRNLKKTTSNGQKLIGDLMSGNNANFRDVDRSQVPSEATIMQEGEGPTARIYSVPISEDNGAYYEVFSKPEGSRAIIPMMVNIWAESGISSMAATDGTPGHYRAKANYDDQILEEEHFADSEIKVRNIFTFRDKFKGRIYSVCEFIDAS